MLRCPKCRGLPTTHGSLQNWQFRDSDRRKSKIKWLVFKEAEEKHRAGGTPILEVRPGWQLWERYADRQAKPVELPAADLENWLRYNPGTQIWPFDPPGGVASNALVMRFRSADSISVGDTFRSGKPGPHSTEKESCRRPW